jgi:hypothetical protein
MHLTLYHGTSRKFARQLLSGVTSSPLSDARIFEFAAHLYKIALEYFGSFYDLVHLYSPRSGLQTTAAIALKNVANANTSSLISYGSFYAALSRSSAANYACRGHLGSELLWILKETIKGLQERNLIEVPEIERMFPAAMSLLRSTSEPVVLSLHVPVTHVRDEAGGPLSVADYAALLKLYSMPGVRYAGSFRVDMQREFFREVLFLNIPDSYDPIFHDFPEDDEWFSRTLPSDLGL